MVKICPECGEKNFDDAKYCTHCNTNIKKTEKQPDGSLLPKNDEYSYYTPRGYRVDPGVREYFTLPGIFFGALSFFFIPIVFIPLAFTLGGLAVIKDDKLGYIAIVLAIIAILLIAFSILLPFSILF